MRIFAVLIASLALINTCGIVGAPMQEATKFLLQKNIEQCVLEQEQLQTAANKAKLPFKYKSPSGKSNPSKSGSLQRGTSFLTYDHRGDLVDAGARGLRGWMMTRLGQAVRPDQRQSLLLTPTQTLCKQDRNLEFLTEKLLC